MQLHTHSLIRLCLQYCTILYCNLFPLVIYPPNLSAQSIPLDRSFSFSTLLSFALYSLVLSLSLSACFMMMVVVQFCLFAFSSIYLVPSVHSFVYWPSVCEYTIVFLGSMQSRNLGNWQAVVCKQTDKVYRQASKQANLQTEWMASYLLM